MDLMAAYGKAVWAACGEAAADASQLRCQSERHTWQAAATSVLRWAIALAPWVKRLAKAGSGYAMFDAINRLRKEMHS